MILVVKIIKTIQRKKIREKNKLKIHLRKIPINQQTSLKKKNKGKKKNKRKKEESDSEEEKKEENNVINTNESESVDSMSISTNYE